MIHLLRITDIEYDIPVQGYNLSKEQKLVFRGLFHDVTGDSTGSNMLVLGKCGTGKSTLIKMLVQQYKKLDMNVSVTATTGTAASLINGFTVERFFGITDLSIHGENLAMALSSKPEIMKRLNDIDVLIMDECSMCKEEL